MHDPDSILLSTLCFIVTKLLVKYLTKWAYCSQEKVERTSRQTGKQTLRKIQNPGPQARAKMLRSSRITVNVIVEASSLSY